MPQNIEILKLVFEAYVEFARLLRTWLVAFGIGGPILFLNLKDAYAKLDASPYKSFVVTAFLTRLAPQVISALIYKWVSWFYLVGSVRENMSASRVYRVAAFLTAFPWIGITADIGAVALFATASVLCVKVLL